MGCGAQTEEEDLARQEFAKIARQFSDAESAQQRTAEQLAQIYYRLGELHSSKYAADAAVNARFSAHDDQFLLYYDSIENIGRKFEAQAAEVAYIKVILLQLRADQRSAAPHRPPRPNEPELRLDFDFEAQERRMAGLRGDLARLEQSLEEANHHVLENEKKIAEIRCEARKAVQTVASQQESISGIYYYNNSNQQLMKIIQTQNDRIQRTLAADHQQSQMLQEGGRIMNERIESLRGDVDYLYNGISEIKFIIRGLALAHAPPERAVRLQASGQMCEADSLSDDCSNIRESPPRLGNKAK